jgi:membrane associated rhomboid family serine protease
VFLIAVGAGVAGYALYTKTPVGEWIDALPSSVRTLLAANTAGFALHYLMPSEFIHRNLITSWLWLRRGRLHTPFLSLFSHGRLAHVLSNCLFLVLFAPPVAERMGDERFMAFCLLAGGAAAVADALLVDLLCKPGPLRTRLRTQPILGASGYVFAIMGAVLFLAPADTSTWSPVNLVKYALPVMLVVEGMGVARTARMIRTAGAAAGGAASASVNAMASVSHLVGAAIGILVGLWMAWQQEDDNETRTQPPVQVGRAVPSVAPSPAPATSPQPAVPQVKP